MSARGERPPAAPRRVTVLGATGSVGRSTLALIAAHPARFEVEALAAGANAAALAEAARRLRPRFVAVAQSESYRPLKEALAGTGIEVAAGTEAVLEAARRPSDWLMAAIVGAAGLLPTLEAVRRGAIVALANKEALVCAGALMMREADRHGARLLPVDSEHNAIFQILNGQRHPPERILLTASGGPFRTASPEAMARATPDQALAHPSWSMGAKITIDSATMMNKGLEIIEAHHLFGLDQERIEVLIHPQSVVHGIVQFPDGSVFAHMAVADMRVPIAHTLAWPDRLAWDPPRLDLAQIGRLDFAPPDHHRFPALGLCRIALRMGGAAPTVINAANEVAVRAFLEGRIGFLDIARTVEEALQSPLAAQPADSVADILAVDRETRRRTEERIARKSGA